MISALVGFSGFVGSNLSLSYPFTKQYNSKNIQDAYGTKPDLLIYAGVPAVKYLANQMPDEDFNCMEQALNNMLQINPKKLVLISTIDVYDKMNQTDESYCSNPLLLEPYGYNRFWLETHVRHHFPDALIIRLPALFGNNIKKNFIYDFIHFIPPMIRKDTYLKLLKQDDQLNQYYEIKSNGYYNCKPLSDDEKTILKNIFDKLHYSALNLTDSRGEYQFYSLSHLWTHIVTSLENNLYLVNLVTEPISIEELYSFLTKKKFQNFVTDKIPSYHIKTRYFDIFQGAGGYIYQKQIVLDEIKQFIDNQILKMEK